LAGEAVPPWGALAGGLLSQPTAAVSSAASSGSANGRGVGAQGDDSDERGFAMARRW
jgi:hypothetical protein